MLSILPQKRGWNAAGLRHPVAELVKPAMHRLVASPFLLVDWFPVSHRYIHSYIYIYVKVGVNMKLN